VQKIVGVGMEQNQMEEEGEKANRHVAANIVKNKN
jgi:hypothetical protein